jgi:hypothetical protein
MKNSKDFIKLFDLNVPVLEHFDYYIEQMSKTEKFKDIKHLIELFEEADCKIEDFYRYKIEKSNEIINFIKSTNVYTELCYGDDLIDLPTNKLFSYEEGVNYVSVDLRSANWASLKKYDQLNELGTSYREFLEKFGLSEVFVHSKYLRQFIFGNVNPKKQQKVQRNLIQEVVREFQDQFEVECVRNDEVIFRFDKFSDLNKIYNGLDVSLDTNINDKYKIKIFTIKRVEDFRVDTVYNIEGSELRKEMLSVNGQLFYLKLKQYITGEPLDIRDLYFKSDGKLALWMIDELNVSI